MRRSAVLLFVASVAVVLTVATTPVRSQTLWDCSRDFSLEKNPNGPWTYGYLDKEGKFTAYDGTFEPTEGIVGWCAENDPDLGGNVTVNVTDRPIEAFGIVWEPGQICLHPGLLGNKVALRWTSPATGRLDLSIGLDDRSVFGLPAEVKVLCKGNAVASNVMNGFAGRGAEKGGRCGDTPELGLGRTLAVDRGDTFDIIVASTDERATGHIALDFVVEASVVRSSARDSQPDTEQPADWTWSTTGESVRRASSGSAGSEFLICALGLRPWPVTVITVEERG